MKLELTSEQSELARTVIGAAMKVHRKLGAGFIEHVYRNALIVELKRLSFDVNPEKRMRITYEGVIVGEFVADLVINDWLTLELKAIAKLLPIHELQLVNYLTALDQEFGLLFNFGAPSLEYQRKFRRGFSKGTSSLVDLQE